MGGLYFKDGYLALDKHPVHDYDCGGRPHSGEVAGPGELLSNDEDIARERDRQALIRQRFGDRPYFLVDLRATLPFYFSGNELGGGC